MRCQDMEACHSEIRAYLDSEAAGYPLLVNVQAYGDYHSLLQKLEQDVTVEKVFVSDFCREHGLPLTEEAYGIAFGRGTHVLVGLSQAASLKGRDSLEQEVQRAANHRTQGHTVVLLEHAEVFLQKLIQIDLRLERRILLWGGEASPLPRIFIEKIEKVLKAQEYLQDIKGLLRRLEHFAGETEELLVATDFSLGLFSGSLYPVQAEPKPYEKVRRKCPWLSDKGVEEASGSEEQWLWLYGLLAVAGSLEAVAEAKFGPLGQLEWQMHKELGTSDEKRQWLYWLALKSFSPQGKYISRAVHKCKDLADLKKEIYLSLLDFSWEKEDFKELYLERLELLDRLPADSKLSREYSNKAGKWEKAAIRYLTDRTEEERFKLFQCLENYAYESDELTNILEVVAPDLALYMKPYVFTTYTAKVASEANIWLDRLTNYFSEYKLQKITNHLHQDFMEQVEEFALERPYNKILPRLTVLRDIDSQGAEAHFIDALGVEYLAYIVAKCKELGLVVDVRLARSELPSITSMNKDFYQFFPEGSICKTDALDECKHHSQKYDYQKCKEPIHLFEELSVIDKELKNIHGRLALGQAERAVIVSDHGASRLAVLKGSESSVIALQEKGEHSGRCAQAAGDPGLPYVAYENGYAVLANYDRFKGGRKADVEVHGGASLEEVLVPVIALSLPGEKPEYSFTEARLPFSPGHDALLHLFSTQVMRQPVLKVKENLYEGKLSSDKQHAEFCLEGIRRKGKYEAEIYEGGVSQGVKLKFEIYKETQEDDLGI